MGDWRNVVSLKLACFVSRPPDPLYRYATLPNPLPEPLVVYYGPSLTPSLAAIPLALLTIRGETATWHSALSRDSHFPVALRLRLRWRWRGGSGWGGRKDHLNNTVSAEWIVQQRTRTDWTGSCCLSVFAPGAYRPPEERAGLPHRRELVTPWLVALIGGPSAA